jgi:hypothetical protein
MAHRTDRKPARAASERQQEDEFQVQDERGWAGQHGQHPTNAEEKQYRPRKGGYDGRSNENSD